LSKCERERFSAIKGSKRKKEERERERMERKIFSIFPFQNLDFHTES